ncbi:MAG TPA: hypothetical protein VIX91_11825 [Candidatus Acidoferrum sp.]
MSQVFVGLLLMDRALTEAESPSDSECLLERFPMATFLMNQAEPDLGTP